MKKSKFYLLILLVFIVSCQAGEKEVITAYTNFDYRVTQEGYKVQFTGTPYDVPVDNCDGARDSTKQEERSKKYLAELDIGISNEVAAELGGDIKIAKAVLSEKIGTALNIRIGAESDSKSGVGIVTPAGKKTITKIQWQETWTQGSVAIIRPDGTYVGVVPFTVLNSLVLQQLSSVTLDCETGDVISEDTTPQILPTVLPEIAPTPVPVSIGTITVPGNSSEGLRFSANQAGKYTFKYISGAYSSYPIDGIPEGTKTWLTAIRVFRNQSAQWNGDAISDNADLRAMDYGYSSSADEAQKKATGSTAIISLSQGDYLTLVAVDGRSYYSDNPGEVNLEVFFTPLQ